jgi:hypothetical protein
VILLFLLVNAFLRFPQNLFEKGLKATCLFSNKCCTNLGNLPANRQRGIKIQKRIVHALPLLKRVLKIQKLLMLKGQGHEIKTG